MEFHTILVWLSNLRAKVYRFLELSLFIYALWYLTLQILSASSSPNSDLCILNSLWPRRPIQVLLSCFVVWKVPPSRKKMGSQGLFHLGFFFSFRDHSRICYPQSYMSENSHIIYLSSFLVISNGSASSVQFSPTWWKQCHQCNYIFNDKMQTIILKVFFFN